ncbi:hypothetical protein FOIG_00329 [Fusarium odoratissimum NRRL 54006]|uniref:Uncharacterized protein n=1 Tax=Fusarium odoratissimum (strain NRRL 54006) TaxID=1089451 RepID=X0K921_FUSO5|nr:uncharacterized protein FOIG_00329 [Fusarium odoratissimum NRRL 54006]EXM10094.1 hypothetical protein FOIG_00329 [Fusarium odoratissimum NRRL 54006]
MTGLQGLSRNHAGDQRRSQGIPALQQRASVGPIRQRVNWGAQMRDRERTAGGGWMSVTKGNGGRLIKEGDEERRIQGRGVTSKAKQGQDVEPVYGGGWGRGQGEQKPRSLNQLMASSLGRQGKGWQIPLNAPLSFALRRWNWERSLAGRLNND